MIKKDISISNIRKVHKLLTQFFKYTVKEGFIFRNPCDNITVPKSKKESPSDIIVTKKTKFEYFSEEEIPKLLDALPKTKKEIYPKI